MILVLPFLTCSFLIPKKMESFNDSDAVLSYYRQPPVQDVEVDNLLSYSDRKIGFIRAKMKSFLKADNLESDIHMGLGVKAVNFRATKDSAIAHMLFPEKYTLRMAYDDIKYYFSLFQFPVDHNMLRNIMLQSPLVFSEKVIREKKKLNAGSTLFELEEGLKAYYYFDRKMTTVDSICLEQPENKGFKLKISYSDYAFWNELYLPLKTEFTLKYKGELKKTILNITNRKKIEEDG